jgi:predicted ATP-binding protein involved in virulence
MKAIYVKNLKLRNIRTFEEEELNLEKENGILSQWTLILGDNGIGKSTLLQCIAWMKPYLPYKEDNPSKIKKSDIQPYINNEENDTLKRLVRKTNDSAYIHTVFVANRVLNTKISPRTIEKTCETIMNIKLKPDGTLGTVKPKFDTNNEEIFYNSDILIYAYSASRRLGKLNINDPDLQDTIPSFIAEKTVLFDAEDILHTSNYAALGANQRKRKNYNRYITKIKEMLVSVLPDIEQIQHIKIITPKIGDEAERQGNVVLTTKHGSKLPFNDASLGYRTTISWTVDLAWRLFQEYPKSKNPLAEPAIVLIDEIDLHLHPRWQREIMGNLSKHFPKVQFIATAHSPLMVQAAAEANIIATAHSPRIVQAAAEANYAVLRQDDDAVEVLNDPKGIDGWRIDQILTSEFFGFKSSRGIAYEKLMNERKKIITKKKINKKGY